MVNENIKIRLASQSDNEGIVSLTSQTPMMGNISIRIDRRPDFFKLLELRGNSFVLVAEINNKIIGSFSASASKVIINGKPEKVYYLADFKVHPDYWKSTLAARLAKAMLHQLKLAEADLVFCTAVYGNDTVTPFFQGRAFLPSFHSMGIFKVLQIIPTPFKNQKQKKYQLNEADSYPEVLELFNDFMQKYQLGPIYTIDSLEPCTLITASIDDKVVAAVSLVDYGHVKQNVLIGLPFFLKIIVKVLQSINSLMPIIILPGVNENVRILYIKTFAYESNHKDALKLLIARARRIAYETKHTFLTIGIHEKDPDLKFFSRYPKFIFRSKGLMSSLKGDDDKINRILNGVPFEDYSLV